MSGSGSAGSTGPIDQYNDLDLWDKKQQINPIERLTKESEFDSWSYAVDDELFRHNLCDLLDSNKARPARDHDDYKKWHQASANVAGWLKGQINRDMCHLIWQTSPSFRYVDEVFTAIRQYCKGEGTDKLGWNAWMTFTDTRRAKFPSAEAFVVALRSAYMNVKNANLGVNPGVATITLMKDLSAELTSWVTVKGQGIKLATEITDVEFQKYCAEAIQESRQFAENLQAAAAKWKPPVNNNPNNKNNSRTPRYKNSPAQGANIDEHAAKLCKLPNKDGSCGMCEEEGHNARNCPYLQKSPPSNWRPTKKVWCYSLTKKRQENNNTKQDGDKDDKPKESDNNTKPEPTVSNLALEKITS